MLTRGLKIAAHVLIFLVAIVVFYLGLGVGLQYDPNLGTVLWIVAVAIAALNVLWIFRSRARAGP
ncbi:MAG: hypothetical protein OXS35_09860 [Dehalococcoidia bacterium]|nr:hypothetical protein [Dehalococcoidia bacterium]